MTTPTNDDLPDDNLQCDPGNNELIRIKAKEEWIKTASVIAERTKHRYALELIPFLASSVTGEPHPDGYALLEEKDEWSVAFVPIIGEEDSCSQSWRTLIQNDHAIAFFTRPDFITVRLDTPCSPLWKGFILLHEASHAHQCIHCVVEDKIQEECRVYIFENRLVEMMFGESYNKILRKAVVTLFREKCISNGKLWVLPVLRELYTASLENLYGPSLSEDEKVVRFGTFMIHAYFEFFTKYYKNDVQQLRTRLLEMIHPASYR